MITQTRRQASRRNDDRPSQPKHPLAVSWATLTALLRESTYLQFTPEKFSFWIKIPPLGIVYMITIYFSFLLGLQFAHNNVEGPQHYAALSIRAAWLAIAQLPLIVLLAGKRNLVGWISGISYERLHVFHRWAARGMLLFATLHMGFENYGWAQYGLRSMEWTTDACPPTGMAAYALLLAMNLITLAPLRHLSYDLVVALHLILFVGLIVALAYHLIGQTSPATVYYSTVFLYIAIALYLVERLTRAVWYTFINIRPGNATLDALEGGATRLHIRTRIKHWSAGAHVLISIPRFGLFQSHPATIVSTPTSHAGELVLIMHAHEGFTKRIFDAAQKDPSLRAARDGQEKEPQTNPALTPTYLTLVDGPYGTSPDFSCFDTLFLIAGGSGISFTVSVLLSIAERARASSGNHGLPLRAIHFIWIVRKRSRLSWITDDLRSAGATLQQARIDLSIQIFVTCDDSMTESRAPVASAAKKGCQCQRPCGCCRESPPSISATGDEIAVEPHKLDACLTTQKRVLKIDEQIPSCQFRIGRPNFDELFWEPLCSAKGESAIAACGPLSMSTAVRRQVVSISDERAVHKGTGAQGIFLHVESFH